MDGGARNGTSEVRYDLPPFGQTGRSWGQPTISNERLLVGYVDELVPTRTCTSYYLRAVI